MSSLLVYSLIPGILHLDMYTSSTSIKYMHKLIHNTFYLVMSHFVMQDMYQFALHIALSLAVDVPYNIVIKIVLNELILRHPLSIFSLWFIANSLAHLSYVSSLL